VSSAEEDDSAAGAGLVSEIVGAIKYEVQPRSSKASRTSDAQAR
jgi:hypothetical protein